MYINVYIIYVYIYKGEIRVNTRTNMNSILKKKKTKNSLAYYISKEASLCYCFIHA